MTVSLKHTFQSAKTDSTDASLIQPSNWNDEHQLTLSTDKVLGRATAGTGAAEEISIGTALSLSGGTLAVTNVPVANGGTGASTLAANNVLLGNGTAALLGDDPRVFTYSIHVGRNYPTKKVIGTLDIETVRYVEGDMYLKQLFVSLAGALDAFAPDLVIWISGADNHRNDRFGQMHLSLKDIQRRDEVLLGAFIKNRIPVAVLYGGGYNREPAFTAKLHRNTIATAKKLASEFRGL